MVNYAEESRQLAEENRRRMSMLLDELEAINEQTAANGREFAERLTGEMEQFWAARGGEPTVEDSRTSEPDVGRSGADCRGAGQEARRADGGSRNGGVSTAGGSDPGDRVGQDSGGCVAGSRDDDRAGEYGRGAVDAEDGERQPLTDEARRYREAIARSMAVRKANETVTPIDDEDEEAKFYRRSSWLI